MPKARKPAPSMYSQKGSTPSESDQKPSTRAERKAGEKTPDGHPSHQTRTAIQGLDADSQEARASASDKNSSSKPVNIQDTTRASKVTVGPSAPDRSTETIDGQPANETTIETTGEQAKEIQPVAFCADGFILANATRLGEEFKLEVKLENGLGFVGTPAFPFSKGLQRGNTWPNGRSRIGIFPRTDQTGRLLPVQQVNSAREILESDTVESSFHLVVFPVDTRGLLTVRVFPQRIGMSAFNVIVRASAELLEVATIAGEARQGVEVFGEFVFEGDGLVLEARTVTGLRLVIPRHHLPGFKPDRSGRNPRSHGKSSGNLQD